MKRLAYGIVPVLIAVLIAVLLSACASGARVISHFGDLRDGEGNPRNGPHGGVDVWGNPGDSVLASADGRVLAVGEEPGVSCGKYVSIEHEPKVVVRDERLDGSTRYCHLREQIVRVGDTVKRGRTIGYIGTTGWTRRPITTTGYEHVHWELRTFGKIDPLPFTVGCFDSKQTYPTDRLVLTYPVQCKNKD